MVKQRTEKDRSRDVILNAALDVLRERGSASITVASVAERAGCAKGLVHYHFRTKQNLWRAAAEHLTRHRVASWREALAVPSPSEAVHRTWTLLASESVNGTAGAWLSMLDPSSELSSEKVAEAVDTFGAAIADSVAEMFRQLDVRTRIPHTEIGWMLASVVAGSGFLLTRGVDEAKIENAYAAAWLGVLSLIE
jgi:AcrR family transcriptional regulator